MSPIVVFAFNRPEALRRCIASLQANDEAKDSPLYVFVDGPRKGNLDDAHKVQEVRDFVKEITGFKSLTYTFSDTNRGLASSIIAGVSQVIEEHGTVIVVEDDLVVTPTFLHFMNAGLGRYVDNERVFSICGYTNKINLPRGYESTSYFATRSSSWGWATWKSRWQTVDWQLDNWASHQQRAYDFNRWGGSDCWKMLNDWRYGRNSSWAIRFCYAQFQQQGLSLFPTLSKVSNEGFDGQGAHCKRYSRFRCQLDTSTDKRIRYPDCVRMLPEIQKECLKYHSIPRRIWSKIMYIVKG